jgi:hypothetical protein
MRAHLDTLKRLTEAEGRDFSALTISYKVPLYDTGIPSPDGSRRPFSGAPEDIAGDIRAFDAIGVHELIFDCHGQSIAESIERLQWFTTDVTPLADCGGSRPTLNAKVRPQSGGPPESARPAAHLALVFPEPWTQVCMHQYLEQAGVKNDFIRLENVGFKGNGHLGPVVNYFEVCT